MKKYLSALLAAILILLCACSAPAPYAEYKKQYYQFFDTFDTVIQIVGYTKTEDEFAGHCAYAQERFNQLHKLYDKFYGYTGTNNINTINQQAGIAPVVVEDDLFALLAFCKDWYDKSSGKVDITLGGVINVWQEYISLYQNADGDTQLPSLDTLKKYAAFSGMDKLVLDKTAKTAYVTDKNTSLDVGAAAKGFATEIVAAELEARGWQSFSISSGGNVRTCGQPFSDVVAKWGIGIQNPDGQPLTDGNDNLLDTVFIAGNYSVVTSGDYQRYYWHEGQRIHHIIDATTLYPANYYRAVTVVVANSGDADVLSTALYCLPLEESKAMAQRHGALALWVLPDGTVEVSDELLPMLKQRGGATSAR